MSQKIVETSNQFFQNCTDYIYEVIQMENFPEDYMQELLPILLELIEESNMKSQVCHAGTILEKLIKKSPKSQQLFIEFFKNIQFSFQSHSDIKCKIRKLPGVKIVMGTILRNVNDKVKYKFVFFAAYI